MWQKLYKKGTGTELEQFCLQLQSTEKLSSTVIIHKVTSLLAFN